MTNTSAINSDINTFVADQNATRGQALMGGGTLALDYNALGGSVPAGGNAVTGISVIASDAAAITLPSGQYGNAVIVDGGISTTAATSGADSFSLLVNANGSLTLTDNNTGNSQSITNASYVVMDGGATTSTGAFQQDFLIATGVSAEIASMYGAALMRQPDFPGLEFYLQQMGTSVEPDLHTVATYILNSPEFKTDWPALQTAPDNGGVNDQQFISELYGNILHRTPDASEINFYVQALQGTLTTNTGAAIPAADRAQLLIYFAISPENQSDISAANGGWLVNPANGAQNFGALSQAAASSVLSGDVASGTINANDFADMSSSTYASQENVLVAGADSHPNGLTLGVNQIDVGVANVTVNLNDTYNFVWASGSGDVVNGYSGGASIISLGGTSAGQNAAAANLFGKANAIDMTSGGLADPIVTPTLIKGWNSTDIIATEVTNTGNWGANDTVYFGSSSNPVNFASIQSGTVVAMNLGTITSSTAAAEVAAIAAAANADLTGVAGRVNSPGVYFYAQAGSDTLIYYWRGDTTHSGHVLTSDFDGAVDLIGVQATSLTSANFH